MQRIKDIYKDFINVHFVGLCMNDRFTLMHGKGIQSLNYSLADADEVTN